MKRHLILISAASLLAAGCSSLPSAPAADNGIDKEKVAAIEGAARRFGVQVYWVNYPQKRAH